MQPAAVCLLKPEEISDKAVLILARRQKLALLQDNLPPYVDNAYVDKDGEPSPKRQRLEEGIVTRKELLVRKILVEEGAEYWEKLPMWMQSSSEYYNLVCPVCRKLPRCRRPEDMIRRCAAGHFICAPCCSFFMASPPDGQPRGTCPTCRMPSMVGSAYGYADLTAYNKLREIS